MTRIIKNFYPATPYGGNIYALFHGCQRKKAVAPLFYRQRLPHHSRLQAGGRFWGTWARKGNRERDTPSLQSREFRVTVFLKRAKRG